MVPYRRPAFAPRAESLGSALTSICRVALCVALCGLVRFAVVTAAQPSCGPWPKPDRWPALLPVLGVGGLFVAAGWWSLGRLARRARTLRRALLALGATAGVLAALFLELLYMSFMTMC